jgi:hypothetical protein
MSARRLRTALTIENAPVLDLSRRSQPESAASQGLIRAAADAVRMTTTTARCDRIIALIDDCLAEQDSAVRLVAGDGTVDTGCNPSRHLHLVRSDR